jgi:hypothetical protein
MALSQDRLIRFKGKVTQQDYLLAADAVIHHHALVAVTSQGYLVPAADTAGYKVVGIATEAADNTGGQNGEIGILVYKGGARLPTTGTSPVGQAHVGRTAYVADDENVVAADTANNIAAGEVLEIDDGFAWVNVGV